MSYYIRNANHLSAVLKQTAKRIRALHDKKIERAPGEQPMRMLVQIDGKLHIPELKPLARHRHCHTRVRSYGIGRPASSW